METINTLARRVQREGLAATADRARQADESREQRRVFADAMQHLAGAYRHELTDEAIRVYWHAIKDVPLEIRHVGMQRCTLTLKFFPTVAELRTACCDVVDERRKAAAVQAKALTEKCPDCHGSGLRDIPGQRNAVEKCTCVTRALALVQAAGDPLARPALPPSTDSEVV